MMHVRSTLFLALAAAVASCGGSPQPDTTPPHNKADKLDVTIASVTLADDCGTGPTAVPPVADVEAASEADEPARSLAGPGSYSRVAGDRACEQSSIQLRVANGSKAESKVAIHKIEVVDESGEVVAELTARAPHRWDGDTYQAWNEAVAPSETLQVSYALTAPYVARGATYTVRVTVGAGNDERTLEQKTTLEAEASLPPDAVT
jgi:hypothetical protein